MQASMQAPRAVAQGAAVAKILSRSDLVEALLKGDAAKLQEAAKKLDLPSIAP